MRPALSLALFIGLLLPFVFADAFDLGSLSRLVRKPKDKSQQTLVFSDRGGGIAPTVEAEDFSPKMSSLFSNVRVPAALFAGASAANAFALPILASDGLFIGSVKRIYALLMIGALSSELLAIIVSTTSMAELAYFKYQPTLSMEAFISENFDFEWTTTQANFLFGMFSFVLASGIRAWISIACPVVSKAALGTIFSSTLLSLSFLERTYKRNNGKSFLQLPIRYLRFLIENARSDPLLAVSVIFLAATYFYIALKTPHVYRYLTKG